MKKEFTAPDLITVMLSGDPEITLSGNDALIPSNWGGLTPED